MYVAISLAACDREPRAEALAEPVAEVASEQLAAREDAASPDPASNTRRAWTPWGRAAEAEEEARHAMLEAQQEAERARAAAQARAEAEAEAEARRAFEEAVAAGKIVPREEEEPGGIPEGPAPASRPEPEARLLPLPPFAYTLRAEAPVAHQGPRPTLEQRSAKRNAIIDTDAWFFAHGLALPIWELPRSGGTLPSQIPESFRGRTIVEAIRGVDHSIAIYSAPMGPRRRTLVVRNDAGDALAALDFSAWPHEQEVHWAQLQDGVLYVCTYHMTYATSTGGLNAFITALELGSGELLWQSEPLVCNVQDFLLRDGWILSGYGFTAEPDFLFVLDMKTGKVVKKKKVKSGPEVILEKSGELYVRTYDHDYVFGVR